MARKKTVLDEHGQNLESAFKAKRELAKIYAKQTADLEKVKSKTQDKIKELLESLTPEVAALVKEAETTKVVATEE